MHESSSSIGGILRDWNVDNDWYFRNCQYLTPNPLWYSLLPHNKLYTFPHLYGSYTDLWGETCINREFAGPVYSSTLPLDKISNIPAHSPLDRLNLYPEAISIPLIRWVKRFINNPAEIHSSGAIGLQISRVFPCHFVDQILDIKSVCAVANDLYGIPRRYFGLDPQLAALPYRGFIDLFHQIENQLWKLNSIAL